MFKIPESVRRIYFKQGYRIIGKHQHSSVKICQWTKSAIRGKKPCFKERWYGIKSHRCLQCTTWLSCLNNCVYCWRSFKAPLGMNTRNIAVDEPSELIDEMIKQQRLLLSGFKGYEDVNMKKWKEAQNPSNVALSLIGESLLYSKLSEILKEFHKKDFTSFLVTKGTLPEKLAKLEEEPTNLYISLCAPDKETYKKIDRPLTSKSWEKQMKSLELMKSFSCRKVIRLTLVKGWNMKTPEKYANLIKRAEPDFLEPKAYMHVGESQKRLPREAMPTMEEVRKFAKELSDSTGFKIKDEDTSSKIVLLANKN